MCIIKSSIFRLLENIPKKKKTMLKNKVQKHVKAGNVLILAQLLQATGKDLDNLNW